MKNVVICKSCNTENPYYEIICTKCHSYLKERIFNLDLWKTIAQLIETPVLAFQRIIQSEHKNFISIIFTFAVFKLFISSIFISLLLFKNENATNIFITRLLLFAGGMFVIILILSLLLLLIIKKGGIKTRYKDIFSILTYSLLPYFFAAFILFPIEIIIFGEYLFSVNPSPYIIKSFLAWAITGFEILLIIWSLFLLTMGIFAQTKSNIFSIIASASINLIIYLSIYCYSVYLAL